MDPIVAAAGSALVGAIATDAWQQARDSFVRLWRRVHPRHAGQVEAELTELHEQILLARVDGDADTEQALEAVWQLKLQELLSSEPTLAGELQLILEQVLTPALTPQRQERVAKIIMTGSSHDSSTFTQIGSQVIYNRQ